MRDGEGLRFKDAWVVVGALIGGLFLLGLVIVLGNNSIKAEESRVATCRSYGLEYAQDRYGYFCVQYYYDVGTGELLRKDMYKMYAVAPRQWDITKE